MTAAVAAIVLAAGRSTRMGADNKLLCEVAGTPMVRLVVDTALASRARPINVVVGHQADQVRAALAGLKVGFVDNPAYASGLASSLRAGLGSLPQTLAGALVLLGDMPTLKSTHLDRLIEAFEAASGDAIIVPVHDGERGNPVLWPARYFPELMQLDGDVGARRLFARHAQTITEVAVEAAVLHDVDTPEALARLRGEHP
ncbi:MAG TPA: nucleotidyltransferase family protein [Hyphomicrobiaceae bacterium]|jgi:molybdenum cofactor cytidylyltransferase|nr:nucleotidyltransferase family protein [Hyphomicrobiaceae bacterium]